MKNDIERILVSEEELKEINKRIGAQISKDYVGKDLLLVGILKGSAVFMTDLMRNIDIPMSIDFMYVSSYGAGTTTSGVVKLVKDLDENIEGKHVLIAEDILDSGVTLSYLLQVLQQRNPASLKLCALLNKPERHKVDVKLDYKGIDIPDEFVVGYGLDYAQKYRNLPYVGILKRSVYEK